MIRSFSFGGGVQSTAALVLAAQGKIDFPLFLFANVGDDSEHPDSLRYVREVAIPYGEAHGIEVVELRHKAVRSGEEQTLLGEVRKGRLLIPVRGVNGAPMGRACTADFKIKVLGRELQRRGATGVDPATVGIGISTDEMERASNKVNMHYERRTYPLLDLRISRDQCQQIIRDAGLEVPRKSSCWFCPFHRPSVWVTMQREEPDLFAQAVEMEREWFVPRGYFLTRFGRPLDVAIGPDIQQAFDFEYGGFESCDEGVCFV